MIFMKTQTDWKKMNREQRGLLIYKNYEITQTASGWIVPSQSGNGSYLVKFDGHEPECNCPDCNKRNVKCKHIFAVEFYLKTVISTKGITQERGVRITYSQNWSAYDKSQTGEKLQFMKLLNDLCKNVEQPKYNFGRPKIPLSDLVFSSVLKVYSTFSLRRFMSDIQIAKEKELIDYKSCYASIGHFMQKEELTQILKELIKLSSLPLSSVETDFAIDSSGFNTSRFARWFDHKWGKEKKYRIWLKAHLISGVKTNIVTGVEITEGTSADSKELPSLVKQTVENFEVSEVSADKAYSSRKNLEEINSVGAVPYIPFKKNTTGKAKGSLLWSKMYHYFMYRNDEFQKSYNKRSNSETVFHMIKSKFKDNLRSKSKTAQVNELLCKILAHNICVVIQEVNELGISAEF